MFFNTFLYTPLEQFDEVTWLSHRVVETLEPYQLFISEIEFNASQLYVNSYGLYSSSISFSDLRQGEVYSFVFCLILFGLLIHQAPISIKHYFYEGSSKLSFYAIVQQTGILFVLAALHVFTNFFVILWFTDFFFVQEEIDQGNLSSSFNFVFAPQIDFSYAIDEIIITLLLGFFLIGGGETEDEEDFILSDQADLNIVEDVVAPLFVANLGQDVKENGALYIKVCAIFSFVFLSNLLGMIPYADTATSSLVLTFWVSFSVFAALVALRISKHGVNYLFSIFMPAGTPINLVLLLIPIEFRSYSFRLVSLALRLFANRMAGHTLRKVLIGFSYVRFILGDGYALAAFLPALVVFVLIFLERAVAVIQAYIFTTLTCLYLKDIFVTH